jgi:1,4-dihydroxy-2-naphthoate octaprenyltransferase
MFRDGRQAPVQRDRGVKVVGRAVALLASAVAFAITAGFLLAVPVPQSIALAVPAGVCALLAALFALARPSLGWKWGLWSSAVFLGYFFVVAISYLTSGRPDWHPVLAGLLTASAATAAAAAVSRLRLRMLKT